VAIVGRSAGRSRLAEGAHHDHGGGEDHDGQQPGHPGAGVDGADELGDQPDQDHREAEARIMTTLVHNVRDNGIRYGLQTMCEGGGQANATILELL
jgi:hypothetical protein